ncbi:thrombomodulin-like [Melanotaenia boesemani]|uniref:thrombomodulin-like n=1 Tax=Melanotaenia boesemani TaxID=1250792 RepID=UPI001C03F2BB|nr:thrombomodulin-like [Melanotaenia boesemani]
MISGTQALLFCALLLCGQQEAAPSPRGRCAEGLCSFQVLLDFRGAENFCKDLNGKLFSSKDIKTIISLLRGLSGRFWLGNNEKASLHDCPAVSVTGGQNVTALTVPCKDKLDGQVCQYESDNVCRPFQASAGAKVKYTTIKGYELVDSEMLPPGTFAIVGDDKYPDSKHLCSSSWNTAPWNCEVLNGGCEHSCSSGACICPIGHTLHPNNISCITDSCAACAQECQQKGDSYVCKCYEGYRLAQDGTSCEDVNECEEKSDICTSEGEKCVNNKGGYKCECADNFVEEDGTCVNNAICFKCEHECDKINGVFQCVCNKNFRVSLKDPTKCERHCGQSQCPASCDPNPDLEKKDMQQCFCPDGYILDRINQTSICYDIDECEQQNPCDHRCENMFGGYRCWCDEGFKLVEEECVRLENEGDELGSGLSSELVTPGNVQTPALPSYVKAGSVMGITMFLVLIAVLLLFLARKIVKRCGRFTLTTFKHPDIDIFYLQQVTTDTYKRLSFDKQ